MRHLFNDLLISSGPLVSSIRKINTKEPTPLSPEAKLLILGSIREKSIEQVEDSEENSDEDHMEYEALGTELELSYKHSIAKLNYYLFIKCTVKIMFNIIFPITILLFFRFRKS